MYKNLVESYINMKDWRVKENSNMDYSIQGMNNHIVQEVVKKYWLDHIYSDDIKNSYYGGSIYINDLGSLCGYCAGWDLKDLLIKGFCGVKSKTESEPPKHFRSALGQIVNFFYTLANEWAGAQAFSHFDTLLAPFIENDGLSYADVKQCLQEFIYNINVPTRTAFQQPFTNLTFDLICPESLKNDYAIIGGTTIFKQYNDFQTEMNMINKAFCEIMLEGDKNSKIFSFPIPTYNITKDFEWDNEEITKPIFKMTAKLGIPYFANYVKSNMDPKNIKSMCCRLSLDMTKIQKGSVFAARPLTGSIGVVSLNMPNIYMESKDSLPLKYYINKYLKIAIKSLIEKRDKLEYYADLNLYPYTTYYLNDIKKRTGKYFSNHFSTIGIIGMHDMLLNIKEVNGGIETDIGKITSRRILEYLNKRIEHYSKKYDILLNLEAVPGESACFKLAKNDKERWPDLQTSGKVVPYYTSNTQLPANATENVIDALDHQDMLLPLYSGGSVFHCFVGESLEENICKQFVKKIIENYKIPYFSITPTFSICQEHKYISGEHEICPECGEPCLIYSRVVGYYRPIKNWNAGKKEEFKIRKNYEL